MLLNVQRIKDDKYFSFQNIFPPSSVKKQPGEAETDEGEEREAGGGWCCPIAEV